MKICILGGRIAGKRYRRGIDRGWIGRLADGKVAIVTGGSRGISSGRDQ